MAQGRKGRRGAAAAGAAPAPEQPVPTHASLVQLRKKAEEGMRSLSGLLMICGSLGGVLVGVFLVIGLGVALDTMFSVRNWIPGWALGIAATVGCIGGLAYGSVLAERWPRRTADRDLLPENSTTCKV